MGAGEHAAVGRRRISEFGRRASGVSQLNPTGTPAGESAQAGWGERGLVAVVRLTFGPIVQGRHWPSEQAPLPYWWPARWSGRPRALMPRPASPLRRERSAPMPGSPGAWLEGPALRMLPKSPTGQAVGYARSNRAALNRYLEVVYLAIDNNAAKWAVRPVAIGREHWPFRGSEGGGRTAAIPFSTNGELPGAGDRPLRLSPRHARSRHLAPRVSGRRSVARTLAEAA